MVGVVVAMKRMITKRAAKALVAVGACNTEDGGSSDDHFFVNLGKEVESDSSAEAALGRCFVDQKTENAFKKRVAHCVATWRNVRK